MNTHLSDSLLKNVDEHQVEISGVFSSPTNDLSNTISQDSIIYPRNLLNNNDPNLNLKLSKAIFCYKIYGSKCSWYMFVIRHKHIEICHPLFDPLTIFLNIEIYQMGITRVNCHYQVRMVSKEKCPIHHHAKTNITFQCNPSY